MKVAAVGRKLRFWSKMESPSILLAIASFDENAREGCQGSAVGRKRFDGGLFSEGVLFS